jgi:L-lactate permease
MEYKYNLKKEEIEEALLCMDYKKEGLWKIINAVLLSIITFISIIVFIRNPKNFPSITIGFLSLIMLFVVLYLPQLRRKKTTKKMYGEGRQYKVKIPWQNLTKTYESKSVFTLQTLNDFICLPKRILDEDEKNNIRSMMKKNSKKNYNIQF